MGRYGGRGHDVQSRFEHGKPVFLDGRPVVQKTTVERSVDHLALLGETVDQEDVVRQENRQLSDQMRRALGCATTGTMTFVGSLVFLYSAAAHRSLESNMYYPAGNAFPAEFRLLVIVTHESFLRHLPQGGELFGVPPSSSEL